MPFFGALWEGPAMVSRSVAASRGQAETRARHHGDGVTPVYVFLAPTLLALNSKSEGWGAFGVPVWGGCGGWQ